MPYYAPSGDEVTQLIKKNDLFDIEGIRLFESNWDAHDDSDGDTVPDCSSSAENIAKIIRAGIEPLIINHFGENILDELFVAYTCFLAKDLEKGKAMCPVIVVMLKSPSSEIGHGVRQPREVCIGLLLIFPRGNIKMFLLRLYLCASK